MPTYERFYSWLFVLLLVLCTPLLAAAQESSRTGRLIDQADSAYAVFDNSEALRLYEQAFLQDSSFIVRLSLSRTHYDFGLDLMARNDEATARTHFEEAVMHARILVDAFPDSAQSHFMLAATMGNLAQFEKGQQKVIIGRLVEQHSRKAIQLDSTWAYPYVSLGIYFRELSKLSWFERALAQMFYGRIPDVKEEDVLALLHRAAAIKPNFAFLHYEIAMTYMQYERHEEALDHLNILVSLKAETSQDVRNQQNAIILMASLKN